MPSKMPQWITLLLLLLLSRNVTAQQTETPVVNASATHDTVDAAWERKLAAYVQAGNWATAISTMEAWAKTYADKKDYQKAITILGRALAISKKNAPYKMPALNAGIGMLYSTMSNSVQALKHGLAAVSQAEQYKYTGAQLSDVYSKVGSIYFEMRSYDSAVAYGRRTIMAAEQTRDTHLIQTAYLDLAVMLPDLERPQETFDLLKTVKKKYPSKDPSFLFFVAYIYTNTYVNLYRYNDAKVYLDEILAMDPAVLEAPGNIELFLFTAVRYYTETGQYDKAKPYLLRREERLAVHFDIVEKCKNEEYLYMADSALGNYKSALVHFNNYLHWKDSIFSLDKAKQLNELQVSYHTEKKNQDIKLLRNEGLLKDTVIQKQALVRNFIIGGLLVLALLLGVSYNRYLLKKKSNALLQQQQGEISEQNGQLKKLVKEKEWLLKEIHHRVKNNLQIVISLLNTQSVYLNNDDARLAIKDSQHRMQAMSLIHQKLYLSESLAHIDMQWYIKELVRYMRDCFHTDGKIRFVEELEAVELDVVQAVPLGLILNESISNAVKYAFPGSRSGTVHISLKLTAGKQCELIIRDNGIGLPDDFDIYNTNSLGTSLMVGLSEQLEGTLELENKDGVWLRVAFDVNTALGQVHSEPA